MGACNLIVKATRLCNLRCAYCNDWRSGPGNTMPFTVLAHLTSAALQDPRHQHVSFIWHGGEPTVLPIDWYRRAFAIQDFFTRPGQQVRNVIQTNGTRLTPEWAEFLREHDVSVGVSIDGPSWLHDCRRVHVGGAGSFDEVVEGLAVLRRAGVRTSVLMVVDEEVLEVGPERIYDFLVEQGITSFGFNAVVPANAPAAPRGTPAKPYVRPAQ